MTNWTLRATGKLAVIAATTLAALAMTGISAQAAPAAGRTLLHLQSGQCLDGSVSAGVRLNTCNSGNYQLWLRGSNLSVVNDHSDICLDASVSQGVRLTVCNGGDYQAWVHTSGNALRHSQSGLCLDGSISSGVRLNSCNGGTYQQWLW